MHATLSAAGLCFICIKCALILPEEVGMFWLSPVQTVEFLTK